MFRSFACFGGIFFRLIPDYWYHKDKNRQGLKTSYKSTFPLESGSELRVIVSKSLELLCFNQT